MNEKIKKILSKSPHYRLSRDEKLQKHREFIENAQKVLTEEEKLLLIKILNIETPSDGDF